MAWWIWKSSPSVRQSAWLKAQAVALRFVMRPSIQGGSSGQHSRQLASMASIADAIFLRAADAIA